MWRVSFVIHLWCQQDLYGRVKAIPLSSGFCLGSCNWLLETQYSKVRIGILLLTLPHFQTILALLYSPLIPLTSTLSLSVSVLLSLAHMCSFLLSSLQLSFHWLLQVCYISSSSTFTTHPCPMDRPRLLSCDVMIMCSLTNAHSANPDDMLGELCTRMGWLARDSECAGCYGNGTSCLPDSHYIT